MRRLLQFTLLLVWLTWCVPAQAQFTSTQVKDNAACTSASANCTVTVTSTGAHHLLGAGIIWASATAKTISSVTAGACNVAWAHAVGSNGGNSTDGWVDLYYCLDSVSGQTSIVITSSGAPSNNSVAAIWEATPTLTTIALDSGATPVATQNDTVSCTACAGVSLSLSSNNKYIFGLGAAGGTCSGVTGTGFTADFTNQDGNCIAHGILSTSGAVTAPTTYTQTSASFFASAAAFQETSSGSTFRTQVGGFLVGP